MSSPLKLYLKANDRIFINGAVLKADRKVCLELLNDAHFLLENHVMQVDAATTPLKQLYYIVQLMVMAPQDASKVLPTYRECMANLLENFENQKILSLLKDVDVQINQGTYYPSLKMIRSLFETESIILKSDSDRYVDDVSIDDKQMGKMVASA
ncbi:MAG: flagellar biosynthesis repressor FlbT [Pseudomonadota bacterium]